MWTNFLLFFFTCVTLTLAEPAQKNLTSLISVAKYTIQYNLDFKFDNFSGIVDIDFTVKDGDKLGNTLMLDIEDLIISEGSLIDRRSATALPITFNEKNLTLNFPKRLRSNSRYTISISFNGRITDGEAGIFKADAFKSKYISTYFYPFFARKAFPCFNDPFIKTNFALYLRTLNAPAGITAFSNTPSKYVNQDRTMFQFDDTPKIPLHGLFFTIGHYEASKLSNTFYLPKNTITVNNEIYYVLQSEEYNRFLNVKKSTVQIFAVPGLPKDTFSGYNVAAVRSDNVYMNLEKITTEQRKTSLLNVFKAVFQQFYGGHLTPSNSSDIWLTESIPIYLKYNAFSKINEWGEPSDYIFYDIQRKVLNLNAKPDSALPVFNKNLRNEEDLLRFISSPAMLKGAGILTMLESVLNKNILIDVFVDYYTKSADGVMSTDSFIKFLSTYKEVVNHLNKQVDIVDLLTTWLTLPGYPYLQARRAGSGVVISENIYDGGNLTAVPKIWKFPVFYSTENSPTFNNNKNYIWLRVNDNRTVSLNLTLEPSKWLVLNVNGTGPYRVNFEDNDWINLGYAINEDLEIFPASTRAKLLSDAFAMLYTGHARISTIFNFLSYLENEEFLIPWLTALDGYKYLGNLLYNTDLKGDFDVYMQNLLENIYKKLGIDGNDVNNMDGRLRQKIVAAMCEYGSEDCLDDTSEDFDKMIKSTGYRPNNDIRPVLYCSGLSQLDNADDWMKNYKKIFDDDVSMGRDVRQVYYEALACSRSENEDNGPINQFLDLIFKEDDDNMVMIDKEDVEMAFAAIYTKPEHTSAALNYFIYNERKFRNDLTLLDKIDLLQSIAPYLTTEDEYEILKEFVERTKPKGQMLAAVQQAMAKYNNTKTFLDRHYLELKKVIENLVPPTRPPTQPTGPTSPPPTDTGPTDTTDNSTTVTDAPTTARPGAASIINSFNLISLIVVYLTLHLIT